MIHAPIDRESLKGALAPFGQSTTLPAIAYASAEVFDWEMRHFHESAWVCVGRSADIAVGTQRGARAGSEGVLLARDQAGALRAFYNVCRHRGHELLEVGASNEGTTIQCPYHGWAYDLNGALKSAPRLGLRPGFEPADHGLAPLALEEWHGFVMVNVTGGAPRVADYAGNLEEFIRPYQAAGLVTATTMMYEVAANWKLVVENYHECYHCPQIHPELCEVTPPSSGRNYKPTGCWVGGSMDLMDHAQTMSLTGGSPAPPLPGLTPEQRRHVYYLGLFPNLLLSLHPDYVLVHRLVPLGPKQTSIECEILFRPEVVNRPGFDPTYAAEFWDLTNRQDWKACESVQRGVASHAHRPGPIAAPEDAVHQFVSMVANGYIDGAVRPPA